MIIARSRNASRNPYYQYLGAALNPGGGDWGTYSSYTGGNGLGVGTGIGDINAGSGATGFDEDNSFNVTAYGPGYYATYNLYRWYNREPLPYTYSYYGTNGEAPVYQDGFRFTRWCRLPW